MRSPSSGIAGVLTLQFVLSMLISGFLVGLARFAIPGPDPMPIWMTIAFGVAGSFLGGGLGYTVGGGAGALLGAVIAASLLIVAYRRFVQRRPITGPDARRRPLR